MTAVYFSELSSTQRQATPRTRGQAPQFVLEDCCQFTLKVTGTVIKTSSSRSLGIGGSGAERSIV